MTNLAQHRHDGRQRQPRQDRHADLRSGRDDEDSQAEVKGDSKTESSETFYLDLFGNTDESVFTKNRVVGTTLNDD